MARIFFSASFLCLAAASLDEDRRSDLCGSNLAPDGSERSGCITGAANTPMPLYLVSDKLKERMGASCLDGSAPGFYFQAAPKSSSTPNSWILYFKGGGWCKNEDDCAERAKTELGGSSYFPKAFTFSGPLDSDPNVNPDFAGFNRAVLWYCDGASFSGNRLEPYFHKTTNQTLYFRGRPNLDSILETLRSDHDLGKATDVLLSGGSAGGLAAYLHADYVHEKVRELAGDKLTRFKAAPVSGFFLMHDNAKGTPAYATHMQYVFNMQNSTGGVNRACIASLEVADHWKCLFANYSYAHSSTPMFPLQSALDAWQMKNEWDGDQGCTKDNFKDCSARQIADLNGYAGDLVHDFQRTDKFKRNGEGGFVESCLEHVAAQGAAAFDNYEIQGVTMQKALSAWWHAPLSHSASAHWFLPCQLNTKAPHQCNPSCSAMGHSKRFPEIVV